LRSISLSACIARGTFLFDQLPAEPVPALSANSLLTHVSFFGLCQALIQLTRPTDLFFFSSISQQILLEKFDQNINATLPQPGDKILSLTNYAGREVLYSRDFPAAKQTATGQESVFRRPVIRKLLIVIAVCRHGIKKS
jgi:hypothetical protein